MLLPVPTWGQTTSYHIGNSLTWDSQPLSMELYGDKFGAPHQAGYHIHNSWPLKAFVFDPNAVTIDPLEEFGKYTEALTNHQWDVVTLQPHTTQSSTLRTDIDSIKSIIDLARSNPANSDTTFYIYEAWPNQQGQSYQSKWEAPLPSGANPFTSLTREYFDLLYTKVNLETDATIRTIPVGEVLYEVDRAMRQGKVPGFTSISQAYRDGIHLDNEIGRYIASATTFATLSGVDPLTLYKPPGFPQKNLYPLSDEVYDAVNQAIRDVLSADVNSGVYYPVTDFDNNGVIGAKDLRLWENSYPGLQYDLDKDGMVSGLDFFEWQVGATKTPIEFDDSPANLDGQGLVDTQDLLIWEQAYGTDDQADLNGDGVTDGLDFLQLQTELTPFDIADANNDRLVNGDDLHYWETAYGYSGVVDADRDQIATGLDFLIWQQEVGLPAVLPPPNVSVVPEPQTLLHIIVLTILSLVHPTFRIK